MPQITDLKHFKHDWLNNLRLHQGKDPFWLLSKTMHQFYSFQLYPELTNQADTNQNIPQKLWRRVEKSGFWRLIFLQLLSLYDSGTRGQLRLCNGNKQWSPSASLSVQFFLCLTGSWYGRKPNLEEDYMSIITQLSMCGCCCIHFQTHVFQFGMMFKHDRSLSQWAFHEYFIPCGLTASQAFFWKKNTNVLDNRKRD